MFSQPLLLTVIRFNIYEISVIPAVMILRIENRFRKIPSFRTINYHPGTKSQLHVIRSNVVQEYFFSGPHHVGRNDNRIAKKLVDAAMSALDKEGINKVALVAFKKNEIGNGFWENIGFGDRDDLIYRNKNIHALNRIDT